MDRPIPPRCAPQLRKPPGLTSQLEDYLETIARLLEQGRVARATDIANQLGVTRATVTSALRNLGEKGLINYQPYSQVTLTARGADLAAAIIRRHQTVSAFLQEVLRVPPGQAEADACRAEHVLSQEVIERMGRFLGFLRHCPRTGQSWRQAFEQLCRGDSDQSDCRECVGRCLARLYADEAEPAPDPL
ncbi:MAG: metal-dependent transcriptional regulator [Pseudomonadota bacterium]